jgi:hypothetical protein
VTSRAHLFVGLATCAGVAFVLSPSGARAQGDGTPAACAGWQVEYTLSGSLQLTDTPLGQGDGVYPVGPGSMILRFDDAGAKPGGRATLVSYAMHEGIKVTAKTLFWATSVTTSSTTRATPDPCGPPEGLLTGSTLAWSLPVPGVRSDGTLFCEGSFCGKFGAPPPGQSELHLPARPVLFKSLQFGPDLQTFTMASTFVNKSDTPKQTAHLALAGREVRRACLPVKPCP